MDFQNTPCFYSGFLVSTFLLVTLGGQPALHRYVCLTCP
jgi:hypothetical protein